MLDNCAECAILNSLSAISTLTIRFEQAPSTVLPTELFAFHEVDPGMSGFEKIRRTIVHFGTDRIILCLRAWSLNEMGYRVLNAHNGHEAIKLAARAHVDAVVLDVDHNHAEVALVATKIKRCRPQVPTIMLIKAPRFHTALMSWQTR